MESVLAAFASVGAAVLVGGLIALVGLALLPRGPRRLRLAGLAFRAVGVGLGSTWLAIGLLWLTPAPSIPGSVVAVFLTIAGAIAIWASLRARRPFG